VKTFPVILLAKMYDKDGKLVRELYGSRLKKVSSIWGARHVEMRRRGKNPHGADHRRSHFNQHVDEKLFAPEDLGNAPATKH
jgi:hypothetical protein